MWRACILVIAASLAGAVSCDEGRRAPEAARVVEHPFAEGEPCPHAVSPALPGDAGCVSVVERDGLKLEVFARLDPRDEPLRWSAEVSGPDVAARADLGRLPDYPRAVGASDVDGDGTLEWWVEISDYASHGAPWAYTNLFFVEGDRLQPLLLDGEPLPINYGGISRLGEGAECRDDGLVLLRAEAQDPANTRWKVVERPLTLQGHEARPAGRSEDRITVDNYVDPRIRRYFHIECHGDTFIPQ